MTIISVKSTICTIKTKNGDHPVDTKVLGKAAVVGVLAMAFGQIVAVPVVHQLYTKETHCTAGHPMPDVSRLVYAPR